MYAALFQKDSIHLLQVSLKKKSLEALSELEMRQVQKASLKPYTSATAET